jgi:hypothetical protein
VHVNDELSNLNQEIKYNDQGFYKKERSVKWSQVDNRIIVHSDPEMKKTGINSFFLVLKHSDNSNIRILHLILLFTMIKYASKALNLKKLSIKFKKWFLKKVDFLTFFDKNRR